jgi:phosphopantothenoylcysteine decarboxylase/phosphopantothenate--cysteine ligase
MGIALARAAVSSGLEAKLILGPTHLLPPPEVETIGVRSAGDMLDAVLAHFSWCDALIMSAAVADYTPAQPMKEKIKKNGGDLLLRLKRTEDILLRIGRLPERRGKCLVGFSLDVGENLAEGRRKLREKGLDMVLVNSIAAFGARRAHAYIVSFEGDEDLGELDKEELAAVLFARVIRFFGLSA